jgi:predicted ATPase/DNA-binding SARP family transcriptional activator
VRRLARPEGSGQGVAMEFRILGSFEVVGRNGFVDLRGAKRRGLLACLVVHVGQPLSADRLVEELWGDRGSDGAARTVQTYMSQLRKLLRGEAASLTTRPGGYALEVDPGDIDAYQFEQGVTAASAEPDAAQRLAMIDEALVLWRGPPLGEFAGAGWADRETARLDAVHLEAQQRRYDALMELDRASEAAAELEQLVRGHALDERLWGQLMLALYRSGRQADALGAYQQARRHLVEELGIEPGRELVDLEHRILDQDPTLAVPTVSPIDADEGGMSTSGKEGWHPRTFLLTDIVDSVSLWERDQAGMSQAMARHDTIIDNAVRAADGELVRTKGEGDSTFSVFVHPSDALAAAAALHEAISSEVLPSTSATLRVRAGVHTGDAESRNRDWYGPAVNRAARLRALATGRQTLVSGVTAGLVADQPPEGTRLLYRGRRALRGIDRPEEVWELVAADDHRLAASASATVDRLPLTLTRFVGRAAELEQLVQLIENQRLITLTGPGGGGKTRLAMELARQAAQRGEAVWLAELAPLRDGTLVPQAVATAMGVETGPDPLGDLLAQSQVLSGLLVVDNCEHLLDACATLTEGLLSAAPDLRVLATSREPLGLAGEQEWPVRPLSVPDESLRGREQLVGAEAVQLLLDRARTVRPDFEVGDEDVASVVAICRALDGIPLAIELAAGRLRSLSLADLAARLGDQVAVLARHRSAGRAQARHRTLRATLDWSYDLLTEDQQTLARRLSVFAGGFRLDAVKALCGRDLDVLDGIDELVAKSLVTFDGVTARHRLLEPIRQYLAGRLEQAGEGELCHRLQAEWVAGLCDRLGPRLLLGDQRARSRRLREESANIDVALGWVLDHDHHETALRIVGSLGQYWCFNDHAGGRRWCEQVVEVDADASPRRRAKALLSAGMVAQQDQAWDRSVGWLRDALAIYQEENATAGQAVTLLWLGRALRLQREPGGHDDIASEATKFLEESLRLSTQLGDRVTAGWCLTLLSQAAFEDQDLDRAEQLSRQVVEECDAAGARHPVGQALCNLAYVAISRGQHDAAFAFFHDAIALYRGLDDPWQTAVTLHDLAILASIAGRGSEALQALAEGVQLDEQIGRLSIQSNVLAIAALVHLARGKPALATSALGAYEAHRPSGPRGGYVVMGVLAETVETARTQLDPAAIATATVSARNRPIGDLIDELIVQPAKSAL